MRFWFDTEFYEDGRTIELISIGIVAEDGREYYAETPGAEFLSGSTDWLKENVKPHLKGKAHARTRIARDILEFAGEKPEFWAYYADYDWVALCQLYGRMIDLPKGWPMFCRDVKQFADVLGNPALPQQTTAEHHALADARWTKDAWAFCTAFKYPTPIDAQVEAAAAVLFCHAQFRGDDYTARSLARRMLNSAAE
jgi:3' exoribonuclease, RNase T-like